MTTQLEPVLFIGDQVQVLLAPPAPPEALGWLDFEVTGVTDDGSVVVGNLTGFDPLGPFRAIWSGAVATLEGRGTWDALTPDGSRTRIR